MEDIFVTGYSKVPKGITISEKFSSIVVTMVVDIESSTITQADCTLATDLSREYVRNILVGEELRNFSQIEKKFKNKYFGSAKKALIAASKVCHDRYIDSLENIKN